MSRAATGDIVRTTATNNVYTVLVIIATLVNLIGFILLFMRFTAVFGSSVNIFQQ